MCEWGNVKGYHYKPIEWESISSASVSLTLQKQDVDKSIQGPLYHHVHDDDDEGEEGDHLNPL